MPLAAQPPAPAAAPGEPLLPPRSAASPPRPLEWRDLDHTVFFCVNPAVFFCLRVLQHPGVVIKTRLQMQRSHSLNASASHVLMTTLRTEGVRGLYRGFGTASLQLAVQQLYIVTYEFLRSSENFAVGTSEPRRNATAAAAAVLLAQLVANPVDVVAQKLIMQGHFSSNAPQPPRAASSDTCVAPVAEGAAGASSRAAASRSVLSQPMATQGALGVARHIVRQHGVAGLWNGFWVSCAQFIPSASLWWACYSHYGATLRAPLAALFSSAAAALAPQGGGSGGGIATSLLPGPDRLAEVLAGGGASGTVALLLNPLDIVRTRAQVEGLPALGVARALLKHEGVAGLWKGTSARLVMLIPQGMLSSTAYELVKRLSARPQPVAAAEEPVCAPPRRPGGRGGDGDTGS